jgi:two-component system sensor histidine kinase/response regulator
MGSSKWLESSGDKERVMEERAVILLVEDDTALLDGMSDTLEMQGYRTVRASNGREGLAVLEELRPDLIISDIMMPEMDGYAFHQEVIGNPQTATIPFIFLTAKSDQADVIRGLREGVDAYLTKPFDLEELLIHVQNKLSRFATIRKQALAQLEELQVQIVNMFSHELRTPLTYIQGYTDLLASSSASTTSEEMEMFLRGLQSGSRRLNRLIDSLLSLVHLDTHVFQREFEDFAEVAPGIGRLINDVVQGHRSDAAAKGVQLQVDIADSLPSVRRLDELFARALGCLVDNAVKFSRTPGSQVLVHAYQSDDRVLIDVIDEGIGVAAADLPHIFDRFRQIDRDRHEQAGIGVGLAIARGLARVHGGDIEVESRLGRGSKFTLWVPVAEEG